MGLGLAGGLLLLLALIQILLPWLAVGGLVALGFWGWNRYHARQLALNRLFYLMLQQQQGRISVLDFAIRTHLTGEQARSFLNQRAKEFFATFEPMEHGDVLYIFPWETVAHQASFVESDEVNQG